MSGSGFSYVALRKCGCICGAVLDDPEEARETWAAVAEWIRVGRTVSRVPNDLVRRAEWRCDRCQPRKKQTTLAL